MSRFEPAVNIIGAGLAGLSAAYNLAKKDVRCRLISLQASERAQSNLAEGGINAVLDVMGENDTVEEHYADTLKGGVYLADPNMVRGLTENAPDIVRELDRLGVPFNHENGHIVQRYFGGQKKMRTTYAKSSTGKALMIAMIDAVRKEEAAGTVVRMPHHRFEKLIIKDGSCTGAQVCDIYTKEHICLPGPVIMACGGFNGLFAGATTGTTANTGSAAAMLFSQGVQFANLEFLQYHPTTSPITGKRLLISEAARGEGGRLFCYSSEDQTSRSYFMEEKFGPKGNLMPRDVVSREEARLGKQVYLDMTALPEHIWKDRIPDLRSQIIHYLSVDPAKEPVPISPGIHFCMGGIKVDQQHRSSMPHLLAAGECACAYHGANRLGGNSLLGALYGGRVSAASAAKEISADEYSADGECVPVSLITEEEKAVEEKMEKALLSGMSILRDEQCISGALEEIRALKREGCSDELACRSVFAEAILECALERKESRGAHTRTDHPDTLESFRKTTVVFLDDKGIHIRYEDIPEAENKEKRI